jgi:hypothetical protein
MDWINLDQEREKWQAVNDHSTSNEFFNSVKCRAFCA